MHTPQTIFAEAEHQGRRAASTLIRLAQNRAEFFRLLEQLEGCGPEIDPHALAGIIDARLSGRECMSQAEAATVLDILNHGDDEGWTDDIRFPDFDAD